MVSESMLRKPLTGLLLLAGAAGGPYLWYETDLGKQGRQALQSATNATVDADPYSNEIWSGFNPASSGTTTSSYYAGQGIRSPLNSKQSLIPGGSDPFNPNGQSLGQLPVVSLAEILRFDITPEWVMSRFPRVSTLLAEMHLDGLRTPLITGSTPGDLAGTLTYYFDRYKQLRRVTIHATVGEPAKYLMELQQAYQMTQEPSLGGSLYVIKWNGMPTSVLHVAPASVVYSDMAYGRYNLFLELNQPGLEYGLSNEARHLIEAGRQIQRW